MDFIAQVDNRLQSYRHATGYFDAQWSGNYFWTPPHIEPDEIKKRYSESEPGPYVLANNRTDCGVTGSL
jgi:hypothetical protein